MAERLDDKSVAKLEPPAANSKAAGRIVYDDLVSGFGVRITRNGFKSFVLNYRTKEGRERRYTIGECKVNGAGEFSTAVARGLARKLRERIALGEDPQGTVNEVREAPDMNELADRYLKEWAEKKKRPRSVSEDRAMLEQHIRRKLGARKVASVTKDDIKALHEEITTEYETPVRANLVLSLASKMFNLAIDWKLRSDNPVKGVERNSSHHRERYLDPKNELERFIKALDKHKDRDGINAIWLLLHTGARRNEVLHATWPMFDLESGKWRKPSSHTKQKREHILDLSPQALKLLKQMRADAASGDERAEAFERQAEKEKDPWRRQALLNQARLARAQQASEYLFPSARKPGQPLEGLRVLWAELCRDAKLKDFRLHDIRHSFASFLLRKGHSLKTIGHLLGHSQIATTDRYSHVMEDMARAAAGDVGRIIAAADKRHTAKVVRFPGGLRK